MTPPSSTFLDARQSEVLPELCLGPSHLPLASAKSARPSLNDLPPPSHCASSRTTSAAPLSPPDAPVSRDTAESKRTTGAKRGKPSRKTTHSQIEKRRREKINDTMQRLKHLVPACHVSDSTLRKLDVLTATADYIEELQNALGRHPGSPESIRKAAPGSISPSSVGHEPDLRRSSRSREETLYVEFSSSASAAYGEDEDFENSEDGRRTETKDEMLVDEVNAAESLIQIAESPMLLPVVERNRMSISELMHL